MALRNLREMTDEQLEEYRLLKYGERTKALNVCAQQQALISDYERELERIWHERVRRQHG